MKILSSDHKQLKTYLQAASEWIGKETMRCFPDGEPKEYLYDLMRDYPQRGGKRFRPALVLLCCELIGGDPEDALTSAVALELDPVVGSAKILCYRGHFMESEAVCS